MKIKKFNPGKYLLFIVIFIILAYIASYVMNGSSLRKENTSTWKEHTSIEKGFTIQHPAEWYIEQNEDTTFLRSFNSEKMAAGEGIRDELGVWIQVKPIDESGFVHELDKYRNDKRIVFVEEDITTKSGKKGIYLSGYSESPKDDNVSYNAFFIVEDRVYLIGITPYNSNRIATFETMLSTFDIIK